MSEFLLYWLKVSTSWGIFYAFYLIALRKLSFYQWNRFYLLSTILLGLCIPLFSLPNWLPAADTFQSRNFSLALETLLPATVATPAQAQGSLSWWWYIGALYILGVGVQLFHFMASMLKLRSTIRQSKQQKQGKYVLVYTDQIPTSSFFNYIFINAQQLSPEELKQVIYHEQVHSDQKHSLDILLFCMLQIVCWFNPLLKHMRHSIEELHEYKVDEQVVTQIPIARYSRLLLAMAIQPPAIVATSGFAKIQLKKRIIRLNTVRNTPLSKYRFVWSIPLVLLVFALFAAVQPSINQQLIGTWQGTNVHLKELKPNTGIDQAFVEANKQTYRQTTYQLLANGFMQVRSPQGNERGHWKATKQWVDMSVGLGKMQFVSCNKRQLVLKVWVALSTGQAVANKQDADFELTYTFARK